MIIVICDFKFLLVKIYQKETVMVELEEAKIFLSAVRSIAEGVAIVDDCDLMNHYQLFAAHLETAEKKF